METNTFNFLGDILLREQLFDFAQIIRENFPGTVSQNTKLSENWRHSHVQPTHGRLRYYEFIANVRIRYIILKTQ